MHFRVKTQTFAKKKKRTLGIYILYNIIIIPYFQRKFQLELLKKKLSLGYDDDTKNMLKYFYIEFFQKNVITL